jgi:hypothetical protein
VSKNGVTNVYTIQHGEEYDWMLPIDRDDYELLIFDGKPRIHVTFPAVRGALISS